MDSLKATASDLSSLASKRLTALPATCCFISFTRISSNGEFHHLSILSLWQTGMESFLSKPEAEKTETGLARVRARLSGAGSNQGVSDERGESACVVG